MIDPEKQAAFVAGLRKMADEAAAKNPPLTEVRKLAESLVSETRARSAPDAYAARRLHGKRR
jgi:hypothetical protein